MRLQSLHQHQLNYLKLLGQEITRRWKSFTFHICVALHARVWGYVSHSKLGQGRHKKGEVLPPFPYPNHQSSGRLRTPFPTTMPPAQLPSVLFQRKKVLPKKRWGSEKPEIADSRWMPKDSWRSGNCTETFHFPNKLATKLSLLGERSSDRFLNGCFVIQPVQPRRGGLSEEV